MTVDKLIQMSNQISGYFRAYPEAEACAGIRGHIDAFWTPRMRAMIWASIEHRDLDPLVAKALTLKH
jgi:formate dehydrogenase subunit delta